MKYGAGPWPVITSVIIGSSPRMRGIVNQGPRRQNSLPVHPRMRGGEPAVHYPCRVSTQISDLVLVGYLIVNLSTTSEPAPIVRVPSKLV